MPYDHSGLVGGSGLSEQLPRLNQECTDLPEQHHVELGDLQLVASSAPPPATAATLFGRHPYQCRVKTEDQPSPLQQIGGL